MAELKRAPAGYSRSHHQRRHPCSARQIPRRPRPAAPVDAEALVRTFVEKLRTQGDADTERLRDAIGKAIAVLQAALG